MPILSILFTSLLLLTLVYINIKLYNKNPKGVLNFSIIELILLIYSHLDGKLIILLGITCVMIFGNPKRNSGLAPPDTNDTYHDYDGDSGDGGDGDGGGGHH